MALAKAPTYGKNSFYAPAVKPKPAVVKPKPVPVIPYLSGGAGGLAQNPIYKNTATLAASLAPTQPFYTPPGAPAAAPGKAPRPALPDFQSTITGMIPGDWEVQAAETAMGERLSGLRSRLTLDMRQRLVDLGLADTSQLGQFGSYIDADTIQRAVANKYSTAAQIATQEQQARAKSEAALAARGILSSGQTTKTAGEIAAEGQKGRFAALQDYLRSGEQGLAGIEDENYQLQQGIAQARSAAAARAAQQYLLQYSGLPEEETAPEAALAAPVAPAAPVAVPKPVKESAAQRALRLRSEALNRRYGLG